MLTGYNLWMLTYMCISVVSLLVYQFWMRQVHFFREPDVHRTQTSKHLIYSPANGTVAYIKHNVNGLALVQKKGETYNLPCKNKNYTQIGIYMSIYDAHHYVDSHLGEVERTTFLGSNKHDLIRTKQSFFDLLGLSLVGWEPWADTFITDNRNIYIEYTSGIVGIITLEVSVNMISKSKSPRARYFIHRGTQVDLLIPEDMLPTLKAHKGQKVSYNDLLATTSKSKRL